VNIQRLKADIWTNIQQNLHPKHSNKFVFEDVENQDPNVIHNSLCTNELFTIEKNSKVKKNNSKVEEKLSFQHLIQDLSVNSRQKDVSLPFYFICLLHLANENVSLF
jgi:hypothetical protein